ncbi:hypothetical protein SteCoe_15754 [Stentor coeruleus]|uniref:PB1 domain-containing protein n=1 Tax=Stentor coeruleus TaxID=5963 RepID=A0A1R2C305_9CILI|nr:hypothetical protein SteCoe_15754 [Stentor coeruleus]
MRIKFHYRSQVYSLGKIPASIDELYDLVLRTLPEPIHPSSLNIFYTDSDCDQISLTTTDSLKEALFYNPDCLHLSIEIQNSYQEDNNPIFSEEIIDITNLWKSLKAVFSIFYDKKFSGLGILVNLRLGLTTTKVLPSIESATNATIYFEDCPAPIKINPQNFFVIAGNVVFFSFQSTFALFELEELSLSFTTQKNIGKGLTLARIENNDVLGKIKYVNIKQSLGRRLLYECYSPCGPIGSPLFSEDLKLLGIQLSHYAQVNEVYSCEEILSALKQLEYNPKTVSLIQSIEPFLVNDCSYETLIMTPPSQVPRVHGISSNKAQLLTYNIATCESSSVYIKDKVSEGVSLCLIPNGIFLSGGKNSLQKAKVFFFTSEANWIDLQMPQAHYTHTSLYINNKIHLIGGRNSIRPISNCESFNCNIYEWEILPSMRCNRSYPSAIEFCGLIYVFGGDNGEEDLDNIEIFDGIKWKLHDIKMPCHLYGMGCLVLDDENVLILGGLNRRVRSNVKVFKMNIVMGKMIVENCEEKIGIGSLCSPYYTADSVYFYNSQGELIKYCRHSQKVYKQRVGVSNAFD